METTNTPAITVADLCSKLQTEVAQGNLFWRTNPPRSYKTGMLYKGLNFLILGLHPLNNVEPRWLTDGERIDDALNLKNGASPAKIVKFSDFDVDFHTKKITPSLTSITNIFSIDCWNTTQLDAALPQVSANTHTLLELLPLIKIPFKAVNGTPYFDAISHIDENGKVAFNAIDPKRDLLDFEPLTFLRTLADQILTDNATAVGITTVPGTTDAIYWDLALELASCRVAFTMGCNIPLDPFANNIRQKIANLDLTDPTEQMKLLCAFADASLVEEKLLSQNPDEPPIGIDNYTLVDPFIDPVEWEQLMLSDPNTIAWTIAVDRLKDSCERCRKNSNDEMVYLRYISDLKDQRLEFYASGIDTNGDIKGYLSSGDGDFPLTIRPEVLWNSFSIEMTFEPKRFG